MKNQKTVIYLKVNFFYYHSFFSFCADEFELFGPWKLTFD